MLTFSFLKALETYSFIETSKDVEINSAFK